VWIIFVLHLWVVVEQLKIEMFTMHENDNGTIDNIHNLTETELAIRKVDMVDIAFDPVGLSCHPILCNEDLNLKIWKVIIEKSLSLLLRRYSFLSILTNSSQQPLPELLRNLSRI
jgi:hypothetical protein